MHHCSVPDVRQLRRRRIALTPIDRPPAIHQARNRDGMAEPAATTHRPAVERHQRVGGAVCFEHRHRPRRITCHTHTQRARHRRDRGEDIGTVTRQPVGHEATVGHAGGEDVPGSDVEVVHQLCGQRDQEPNVVEMTAIRRRRPPVGPAFVVAVRIDNQQVGGVGNSVEIGESLLSGSGAATTVQADHQPGGLSGRHVQAITAGQAPELERRYRTGMPGQ